jgi:hypothetical protein
LFVIPPYYRNGTDGGTPAVKMEPNQEMLAKMEAKKDTTLKEMKGDLTTRLETKVGVNQEKTDNRTDANLGKVKT